MLNLSSNHVSIPGVDGPMNDLNKQEWDRLEDNLDNGGGLQDAARQLEDKKNRLLADAMEDLRRDRCSQEQVLQMAKRLAQLKGQDPDKGKLLNVDINPPPPPSYKYFIQNHTIAMSEREERKPYFNSHWNASVWSNLCSCLCDVSSVLYCCAVTVFCHVVSVTMEDFQHPDSEDETEEEAMTRILKKVCN